MPCPHRVIPGAPGSMTITVKRLSNVNQVVMRVEALDRSTQQSTSTNLRTAQLEQGVQMPTKARFSYNLVLLAVRSSASSNGIVKVEIEINGVKLVDSNCSVNGTNPTGSWTIIVP